MNRRQHEIRRRKLEAAKQACADMHVPHPHDEEDAHDPKKDRPAKPSSYGIKSLDAYIEECPVSEVYLYSRTSSPNQRVKPHLRAATRWLQKREVKVIYRHSERGRSGKSLDPEERSELFKALNAARKRGVPLVVPCISRLIRHAQYDASANPNARPTVQEIKRLMSLAEGVQLLTLNDPDSYPLDDENFLRNLIAEVELKQVGRPKAKQAGDRKKIREEYEQMAQRMHQSGKSYRFIAVQVSKKAKSRVSHTTVKNWIEEAEQTQS